MWFFQLVHISRILYSCNYGLCVKYLIVVLVHEFLSFYFLQSNRQRNIKWIKLLICCWNIEVVLPEKGGKCNLMLSLEFIISFCGDYQIRLSIYQLCTQKPACWEGLSCYCLVLPVMFLFVLHVISSGFLCVFKMLPLKILQAKTANLSLDWWSTYSRCCYIGCHFNFEIWVCMINRGNRLLVNTR